MNHLCARTCAILLALSPALRADELPIRPVPQPAAREHVANREYWLEVGAVAGAFAADLITTKVALDRCASCVESGGAFNGTRDIAKPALVWGLVNVGAAVTAYEWKRHVHNRWLHWAWRAPLAYRAETHGTAAFHNSGIPHD